MGLMQVVRRWWQRRTGEEETPFDGDTPAWLVSLLMHVGVLLGLASAFTPAPEPVEPAVTILHPPSVEEPEIVEPETIAISEEATDAVGAEGDIGSEAALAVAPLVADESVVMVDATEVVDSDIKVDQIEDVVPNGLEANADFQMQGDVAVGTSGASGAVDRLTAEIAASLEQRPTLVCWVFDQSVSLAGQRREIAARLERVFDELGVIDVGAAGPQLFNLVYGFGDTVTEVVGKPTRDVDVVVKAIQSIPVDESGVEKTFEAIHAAAARADKSRSSRQSRNVMVIAFTDEVGNDEQRADEVAAFCRGKGVRVYVVGVPAPFGMRQVQMKFVEFDPKYRAGDEQWAVVDQGPETLRPEVVRVRSGRRIDEPIDSGFGPFSLSKLCAQTGGIYFAVHANRGTAGRVSDEDTAPMASRLRRFFDPEAMRAYKPDYLPAAKIEEMLRANKAKRALVEAAQKAQISPLDSPRTVFPREDDGAIALLFSEAQKAAAVLQPKIDVVHGILAAGQSDRKNITEKRWQAGYDLAMGRVLALKVRTDAYNQMLAQAKSGLKFKNPTSDTWVLEPHATVKNVGSQTEKLAAQARTYLERVVSEHPGTPWAMIAAEELAVPLGYAWKETHTGVEKQRMAAGGGNNNVGPDPTRRMLAPPKPTRPLKNL
ncbi:MAG: vWA domain-containing protein [Planctomycetaceae bacterium]